MRNTAAPLAEMSDFNRHWNEELAAIKDAGLLRSLRPLESAQGPRVTVDGRLIVNFSSNDYLGLANHPALKEAAVRAVEQYGAGTGASRLICGSLAIFHELEDALADWKRAEACLTFSTGYAAALGVVPALVGKNDVIVVDKLIHACVIDAARLSGATLRAFRHNDPNDLERILKQTRERRPNAKVLVITESVFSMDGDVAPLRELVELKNRYGACLMVDEAHATGVFGERRGGLIESLGLSDAVDVQMGTLGKALGASGGYICGSRALIDLLINRARSFIFSTAPVPAAAAAALAAVRLVQSDEGAERCAQAWRNVHRLAGVATETGPLHPAPTSPILPFIVGDETEAVRLGERLLERGFLAPAVRYPTVRRGRARLRITLSAGHRESDIDELARALTECGSSAR